MTWVKIDDQFFFKPRARQAGKDGRALFWAGLCYCAANLTDGAIVKPSLSFVAAMAEVEPSIADLLVDIGLWEDHGDRYQVIDYLTFQQSREQVVAEREAAAERKRRQRDKDRSSAGEESSRNTSRRDSHRDTRNGHAVSSDPPSPSLTSDLSSRRPRNSRGADQPRPDDDEISTASTANGHVPAFPLEVWALYADRKHQRQPGKVRNPVAWKLTTGENARLELGEQAVGWWRTFECTPAQLADWLLDGRPHPSAQRRPGVEADPEPWPTRPVPETR